MRYRDGDFCDTAHTVRRSATIDVQCSNTYSTVVSAIEPSLCNYHLVVKSYHGCPQVSYLTTITVIKITKIISLGMSNNEEWLM